MLRTAIGFILLGAAAGPAAAQSISFEDAKKGDEAKKLAFLDQELGKLVFDKEKNPKGLIKGWFFMGSAAHKKAAEEAMKEEYKKDGRESFYDKEVPAILQALEVPATSVFPFYRETANMAQRKCLGYLLVGNLFGLQSEDELRSTLDDYALTYVKNREETMAFKDGDNEQELNPAIPILRDIAHMSLLNLYARSVQIEKIAGKARKVSDDFKKAVAQSYLGSLKLFYRQQKKEIKIFDDNNENTLQKEIVDFLQFMSDYIQKNLKKVGVEQKAVDKENFEYTLEGL